jgi:hypothetical protein
VRVRVVLLDAVDVLVQDAVEGIGGFPTLAVDHLHRELRTLVRDVAQQAHAPADPEVAGQMAGVQRRGGETEAHPVR